MSRGRPKGTKLDEATLAKMKAGRALAKENRIKAKAEVTNDKPIMIITGQERDAFDFFTPLRNALRPAGKSSLCVRLTREITQPGAWQNIRMILNILEIYVTIKEIADPSKISKLRKITKTEKLKTTKVRKLRGTWTPEQREKIMASKALKKLEKESAKSITKQRGEFV